MASTVLSLDTTLRDLYAIDNEEDGITLVYAVPTAEVQMATGIPCPKDFPYQSPACPTNDGDTLAREFLQLVPQLFGFVAGKMPLVMFDLDEDAAEKLLGSAHNARRPHQADAHRVLDSLTSPQRPTLTFVQQPSDIKLCQQGQIAVVNPMDCLLPLPHLVHPRAHYEALSKRSLALSGLPTPKTEIIDTVLGEAQISDLELVDFEAERMMSCIRAREPPFVVKMPQSLSGQGTFIIRSDIDREKVILTLTGETRRMLRQINAQNADLNPCSLLLQSIVLGEAVALSLFVTRSGLTVFNACCTQLVDAEGNWGGGCCDYRLQDMLQSQYETMANQIGAYLHKLGYWGPTGADIMTDAEGRQLVIGMNVRVTGSHPLGALRGHFQKRGLNVAVLFFPLMLRLTRDEFDAQFDEELCLGSMVVNAWVHMKDRKTSMTTITLAAQDQEKLQEFIERLNRFKLDDH